MVPSLNRTSHQTPQKDEKLSLQPEIVKEYPELSYLLQLPDNLSILLTGKTNGIYNRLFIPNENKS